MGSARNLAWIYLSWIHISKLWHLSWGIQNNLIFLCCTVLAFKPYSNSELRVFELEVSTVYLLFGSAVIWSPSIIIPLYPGILSIRMLSVKSRISHASLHEGSPSFRNLSVINSATFSFMIWTVWFCSSFAVISWKGSKELSWFFAASFKEWMT